MGTPLTASGDLIKVPQHGMRNARCDRRENHEGVADQLQRAEIQRPSKPTALWHRQLSGGTPAFHPGIDILERKSVPAFLEGGNRTRILRQRLGRPWAS